MIETLEEIRANYNFWNEKERPYYEALSEAIRVLKAQKDKCYYAKIVRCRECKHREQYECNHIMLGKTKCGVTDVWFCADGERKVQDGK